jgi:hypothetical protein
MNVTINIVELASELANLEIEENRSIGEHNTIEDETGCLVYTQEAQDLFDELYDKYYSILEEYNKALQTNNTKSETQKENWINQDEVKKIYETLTEEVKPFLEKKKLSQSDFDAVLSWVVLSLYTLQPPRRNLDYQKAVLVNKYTDQMPTKFNYYDIPSTTFYYNN